jgi:BMFP domain-containing protein YqiC
MSDSHTQYTEHKDSMGSTSFVNRISDQIQTLIRPFLQDSKAEVTAHIQRLIKKTLQNQGLVTREMFDVQSELLKKARLKLEILEVQLKNHLKNSES